MTSARKAGILRCIYYVFLIVILYVFKNEVAFELMCYLLLAEFFVTFSSALNREQKKKDE